MEIGKKVIKWLAAIIIIATLAKAPKHFVS
jgi:hypothetical protein